MSAMRGHAHHHHHHRRFWPYTRNIANYVFRVFGYVPMEDVQDLVDSASAATPHFKQDISSAATSVSENAPGTHDNSLRQLNINNSRDPFAIANSVNIAQPEYLSAAPTAKSESTNADHPMEVDNSPHPFSFAYAAPETSSFSALVEAARNESPTNTPKKRLAKNPNGSYRWEGGGSAKHARPRNRHGSPAFGASPSKSTPQDNPQFPESPLDNKRRRTGEEGATGSRQSASNSSNNVPFPATSTSTPPRPNGIPAKPAPLTSSRLRTPAKPTTPVVPSPLRQAWSDSPSPSSRDEVQSSSHPSKQTKTANFMAELIKETTPIKKPDLSNPYQTASPVGKTGPPRRGTKRPRATGKPSVPVKEQELNDKKKDETKEKPLKEYSAQAIIEATVPKGSKRSRPPAHFETRAPSHEEVQDAPVPRRETPVIVETRKQVYIVEEPDEGDDDSARVFKRSKPSDGNEALATAESTWKPEIIVEEVKEDVVVEDTGKDKGNETDLLQPTAPVSSTESTIPSSPVSRSSFSGVKPSSIPKEPSKLRFSFQAETSSMPPSPAPAPPASLPETPSSRTKPDFKFTPPSESFSFTYKVDPVATSPKSQPQNIEEHVDVSPDLETTKTKVRAVDPSSLPVFDFGLGTTSVPSSDDDHIKAQNMVKALTASSLPTFELGSTKAAESFSFNHDLPKTKLSSNIPNPDTSVFGHSSVPSAFNFGSPAPKPTLPSESLSSSVTPAPTAPSSSPTPVPVVGFNFAAAGMKLPTASKGTWTCSLCGLSSPDSASKCIACETPK